MTGEAPVFHLVELEEVASTNEEVKRAIRRGEPEGFAVRARRQSAGYGRQGRRWESPTGGLYLSVLLRPCRDARSLPTLTLACALAVRNALASMVALLSAAGRTLPLPPTASQPVEEEASSFPSSPSISVKWPNDIVCAQGKLAGMSAEVLGGAVCLGIGVNVFPPALRPGVGDRYAAAYLADLVARPIGLSFEAGEWSFPRAGGVGAGECAGAREGTGLETGATNLPASLDAIDGASPGVSSDSSARKGGDSLVSVCARRVLDELASYYAAWNARGFKPFAAEYRAHHSLAGRFVAVKAVGAARGAGQVVCGQVRGVDDGGRLLVRTDTGVVRLASGEAHVLSIQ